MVFLLPYTMLFALTISETVSPAPNCQTMLRKNKSVTPAIGAIIKLLRNLTLPKDKLILYNRF